PQHEIMPADPPITSTQGASRAELVLEDLAKRFGSRRVFQGISASAATGECLVVTGPNGSGKSTLLAVIAGLLRPNKGKVVLRFDGSLLEADERRDRLALVAPDLTLYHELTGAENLLFFARLRGREVQ